MVYKVQTKASEGLIKYINSGLIPSYDFHHEHSIRNQPRYHTIFYHIRLALLYYPNFFF